MSEIPFRVQIDGSATGGNVELIAGNSGLTDAFARLRVSSPFTLFDSKQLHDNLPNVYDDAEVSGSGTASTYNTGEASTTIAVADATAGVRVRQTYQRFNYQPGKSKQFLLTYVPRVAPTGDSGYRIGTFDAANGIYLQYDSTGVSFAIRTSVSGTPVDNTIAQADWNIDALDGTGPSGITLDLLTTQIFMVDYEWLGVGTVRFGFVIDGQIYYAHAQNHANILSKVYMSTPNLPVRYEVYNGGTGNACELDHICSTVTSEGGQTEYGRRIGVSRGATALSLSSVSNTWYPMIATRQKSDRLDSVIKVLEGSLGTDGSDGVLEIALFRNPVITGTVGAWVGVDNTSLEYNTTYTALNTLDLSGANPNENSGIVTFSASRGGGGAQSSGANIPALGSAIDGTRDIFVYAVRRIDGGGTIEVFSSIVYRELL